MNKPVVWAAQEPMRKDNNGIWVPKGLDFSSVEKFGTLEFVWGPDASIMDREALEVEAQRCARQYDPAIDYIVALGSPTLIAILAWAIGTSGKQIHMLEWQKGPECYQTTLEREPA